MGINPRRAPPGAPAARPTNAPQIKPGVQAETFRRAAADMRKAGAPPNVIEPVLAAEQEARQRLSEAKASSKVEAARHAANQAQTAVESTEAIVAAAEEALAKARERLERCKQRHHERVAAIQVEEGLLVAAKPAEIVAADMATKASRLLEWFHETNPEVQLDTNGDALEPTIDETEHAVVKETLKDLWIDLQTRGGNPEAGQALVVEWCTAPLAAKSSGPLRAKPPIRTTPYGPSIKPLTTIPIAADRNRAESGMAPLGVFAGRQDYLFVNTSASSAVSADAVCI